jgi:hypothetical protein
MFIKELPLKAKCRYCREEYEREKLSRDHFLPKCDGYSLINNIIICCIPCNSLKSNLNLREFKFLILKKLLGMLNFVRYAYWNKNLAPPEHCLKKIERYKTMIVSISDLELHPPFTKNHKFKQKGKSLVRVKVA